MALKTAEKMFYAETPFDAEDLVEVNVTFQIMWQELWVFMGLVWQEPRSCSVLKCLLNC